MLILAEFVFRVKAECPVFDNRVGGTMGLADALAKKGYDIAVPHAFIVPIGGEDETILYNRDSPNQDIRQRFTIVVCVDNSVNRGSDGGVCDLAANNKVVEIQEQLEKAFMGWRPVQRFDYVRYVRDRHIAMDNKRLWHEFEWQVSYEKSPDATDEEAEAINAILNDIDSDNNPSGEDTGLPPGNFSTILKNIYLKYNQNPPIDSGKSLNDGYPRSIAHPGLSLGDANTTQAHRQGADIAVVIPAVVQHSAQDIGDKVANSTEFPADTEHGVFSEES